jgi:hypothetical protein
MSWQDDNDPPPPWQQPPPVWQTPPSPQWGPSQPPPSTSGLAIASLICSIAGFVVCQIVSIVGIILGIVALNQIGNSMGTKTGRGLAIAGIVVGVAGLALIGLLLVVFGVGNIWSR